jgi:hypothetical protein
MGVLNDKRCKKWLQNKYPDFIETFTDENIKNAILQLPDISRDIHGNYTGSEKLLLTPFGGISDFERIKFFIIENENEKKLNNMKRII